MGLEEGLERGGASTVRAVFLTPRNVRIRHYRPFPLLKRTERPETTPTARGTFSSGALFPSVMVGEGGIEPPTPCL